MRFYYSFAVFIIILIAGLMYWASINISQNKSLYERVAYLEGKSADAVNYKFIPSEPGQYEIIAIGNIKIAKDFGKIQDNIALISFTDVSVSKNNKLVSSMPNVLSLALGNEIRKIKIISFSADSDTEYWISIRHEGIPENAIEVVIISDPHAYKDSLISAVLLKTISYVLLFIAIVLLAWRLYIVKRKQIG
jgi:hypothetical protein